MQDKSVFSWRSFHFFWSIIIPGSWTMETNCSWLGDAVFLFGLFVWLSGQHLLSNHITASLGNGSISVYGVYSSSTLMLELVHIQIVMPKSINYSKNKYF